MSIRVVRLGTARATDEGLRIGTVRKPPRGVKKSEFASRNYYDVWLPQLAPSADLVGQAREANDAAKWARFVKKFKAEMAKPDTSRMLDLLAALSKTSNFAVGCYCEDEAHCHRSVLRQLLAERGAEIERG
jgi:uncharacterized protein YeaO (DUF488 family)